MANLFNQLSKLKGNIFGGKGNTGETKPPATRVQDIDLQSSPTGILKGDSFQGKRLSYPMNVQNNYQNGHYMLFYVNVQDKTKYEYTKGPEALETSEFIKGLGKNETRYKMLQSIRSGKEINPDFKSDSDGSTTKTKVYIPGFGERLVETDHSKSKTGVSSAFNNTHRITDSVAMYLPPSVEDTTTANYNDSKTGIAGFLVATGVAAQGGDAAKIAKSLVAGTEGILGDMAAKSIGAVAELAK